VPSAAPPHFIPSVLLIHISIRLSAAFRVWRKQGWFDIPEKFAGNFFSLTEHDYPAPLESQRHTTTPLTASCSSGRYKALCKKPPSKGCSSPNTDSYEESKRPPQWSTRPKFLNTISVLTIFIATALGYGADLMGPFTPATKVTRCSPLPRCHGAGVSPPALQPKQGQAWPSRRAAEGCTPHRSSPTQCTAAAGCYSPQGNNFRRRIEVEVLPLIKESALSVEVLQKWKSLIATQGGKSKG